MSQSTKSRRRRTAKRPNILAIVLGPVGIAVLMVAIIGGLWFRDRPEQVAFEPNTTIGEAALASVQSFPDKGREHVDPGQSVNYDSDFPTSGPHDPNPVMPGIYSDMQRPEQLVHSLEHGNIVIYVDEPTTDTIQALQSWVDQFSGPWDGIVVTPKAGLDESVVLTAWTKKLVLDEFQPEAAATFIDAYRGRGPENPVR